MSKYPPLNIRWRFLTKEGRAQFKSFFYRIYINIFGIFLRVPILPMGFDKIGFDFWYHGDTIIWSWKKRKWISCGFSGSGEFGDACYDSLRDLDRDWEQYFEYERKIYEKEDKEYQYKLKNGLCAEVFCNIEGEHKKHE